MRNAGHGYFLRTEEVQVILAISVMLIANIFFDYILYNRRKKIINGYRILQKIGKGE